MALVSGEGTACISCHTSLPYALVEPLLAGDYPAYQNLIENIDGRILTRSENTPWYSDAKLEQTAALANGKFEAFGLFLEAMRAAFPDMPPPPAPPPVFSLAKPADFKSQMEAAGFNDVEVNFVTRDLETDGFEDLWAMLTVGAPPVQVLLGRVGPAGRYRLRDVLGSIGSIQLINAATVGVGVVR